MEIQQSGGKANNVAGVWSQCVGHCVEQLDELDERERMMSPH